MCAQNTFEPCFYRVYLISYMYTQQKHPFLAVVLCVSIRNESLGNELLGVEWKSHASDYCRYFDCTN